MALPCGTTPAITADTLRTLQFFVEYKDDAERHVDWPIIQSQLIVHCPEVYNHILIWNQAKSVEALAKLAVIDSLKLHAQKLEDLEGP